MRPILAAILLALCCALPALSADPVSTDFERGWCKGWSDAVAASKGRFGHFRALKTPPGTTDEQVWHMLDEVDSYVVLNSWFTHDGKPITIILEDGRELHCPTTLYVPPDQGKQP